MDSKKENKPLFYYQKALKLMKKSLKRLESIFQHSGYGDRTIFF